MSEELIYEDGDFDVFQDDKGGLILYPKGSDDGIGWATREDAILSLTELIVGIREAP